MLCRHLLLLKLTNTKITFGFLGKKTQQNKNVQLFSCSNRLSSYYIDKRRARLVYSRVFMARDDAIESNNDLFVRQLGASLSSNAKLTPKRYVNEIYSSAL